MEPPDIHIPEKKLQTDPFRERAAWWTEPGAVVLLLVFVLLGALLEFYAYRLGYTNVLVIFGIFWSLATIVVMVMYRRSQYESRVYVHEGTVARTKEEILQHRAAVQKKFVETELAILERNEKTTVLDSWRLDPAIRKSHPYFSKLELTEIDPSIRELHLRVQLEHHPRAIVESSKLEGRVLAEMLAFFRLISGDKQLKALEKFFDVTVLELYAFREDESGRDVSSPFFSLLISRRDLPKFVSSGHIRLAELRKFSEARFEGGKEVEPHRALRPSAASRGK
jgi:membrane protein YdbS with pleckstrin-like domain